MTGEAPPCGDVFLFEALIYPMTPQAFFIDSLLKFLTGHLIHFSIFRYYLVISHSYGPFPICFDDSPIEHGDVPVR